MAENNEQVGGVALRRFKLVRHQDISGVSGTGVVAEGVRFSDATVALRWLRVPCQTSLFASVGDLLQIHGHSGKTVLQWVDEAVPRRPAVCLDAIAADYPQ